MSEITRFSSRRQRLDHAFLSVKLKGARSYRRIAGYVRSSIFELVGEEIATIPKVRIVCNSELGEMMDQYIHLRQQARDVFEVRYQETIDPDQDRWELCSMVLARRDVIDRLSIPW